MCLVGLTRIGTIRTRRTRYFLGNDDEEYKWKLDKGSGQVMSACTRFS